MSPVSHTVKVELLGNRWYVAEYCDSVCIERLGGCRSRRKAGQLAKSLAGIWNADLVITHQPGGSS